MADCYLPSVTQGCSWSRVVTWDDSAGAPLDLTGYTRRMQFRRGSSLVLELSSTLGGVAVGTTDGQVTLSMDPGQTAELPEGTLSFGLLMTSPGGVVTELLTGALAVLPARVFGDSPQPTFPTVEAKVGISPGTYAGTASGGRVDCTGYRTTVVGVFAHGQNVTPGTTAYFLVEESDDDETWTPIGDAVHTTTGTVATETVTRSQRYVRADVIPTGNAHFSATFLLEPV